MSDDPDDHITRREIDLILARIDQQFKAQFNRILLVVGLAVGFIKVDTVSQAGALAVVLVAMKLFSFLLFRA